MDYAKFKAAWRFGRRAIEMQNLVRKSKMPFQAEYEKRVSRYSYRTALRRIDLAMKADLAEYPSLMVLGQTRVLNLIRVLPKNQKVGRFLTKKGVKTTIDVRRKKEIDKFQNAVDGLTEKLKLHKGSNKKGNVKTKKSRPLLIKVTESL